VDDAVWMREIDALAMHAQQISLFGGSMGIRDIGLLESALAPPKNLGAYVESTPTLAQLASAYAAGISSNHPFLDGNKRTALVVSFAFLDVNGLEVTASQEDAYLTILGLAAGEISEEELALWFARNTKPR
jgi:death-on-curing protein